MRATSEELACLGHNTTSLRLLCLNNIKAKLYLPVTIFLAILIIVGTIGNATVCLVYWKRKSRSSSHYFILSLAILDLVTCVVGMPTEIADLVLPYTFESPLACKILRFTHSSTIIASSTILIQVAFDRYYRICQLGRQFTANKARLLCLSAVLLGFLCSWPTFILFGRKTVTRVLNGVLLKGTDCSTDDSMRHTIYPTIYYIFLFSLFGITVTFFVVLYSKIGLKILRRKRFTTGSVCPTPDMGRGVRRTGSKKTKMCDPPSSDISSDQDNGHGHSTASSNSSGSNNSNISTCTGSTSISTILYGNFRRVYKKPTDIVHQGAGSHYHSSLTVACIGNHASVDKRTKIYVRPCSDIMGTSKSNTHAGLARSSGRFEIERADVMNSARRTDNIATADRSYSSPDTQHRPSHQEPQPHHTYAQQLRSYCNNDATDDDDDGDAQPNQPGYYHSGREQPVQRTSQRQIRAGKTTTVLFAVTLAYILSFLPYLTVMVMRSVIKDLEENLSPVGELAYKLCVKSFFINNAINPLIYSFLNQAFRKDAKQMLSKSCGCSKRPVSNV